MGNEGEWTIYKMPGYTGFIPGTRHIYGRSFGRIPPLSHMREKKTESSEMSQEMYRPKNIWQVILPPVKFIPGYTGHLPGKNHVFGKTFAQQAEECFINLKNYTKRNQEQKLKQEEMEQYNRSNHETEHHRTPVSDIPQNAEDPRSRTSPEKFDNPQPLPNEKRQTAICEESEKSKSRYDMEANEDVPERIPERQDRHQRYRTQSDGLSRYHAERRNPNDIFKHLKYESPLKSKYQSSEDVRNDEYPSKYDKRQLNQTPYPEDARDRDRLYDYESPNRVASRMRSQMNNSPRSKHELSSEVRPSESKYETAVRPTESKYNLSPNYRTSESTNDQAHIYRTAEDYNNTGDKYDDLYGVRPDGRQSLGINRDAQNPRDGPYSSDASTEERNVANMNYNPSYTPRGSNQDPSQNYPASERGGCSCCAGRGDVAADRTAGPSHHQASSQQLNPPESALLSETADYTGQRSFDGGRLSSTGLQPSNMNARYPTGYEHLQQATERVQTASDGVAYSNPPKGYDRSRPESRSVKFQDSGHNTSPMNSVTKPPSIYKTSYDDYNNSARYFSSALNPPISGYRGYIPRMNSTSALGIPFATHINTNVRT